MITATQTFKHWLKTSHNPGAMRLYQFLKQLRVVELPAPGLLYRPLLMTHKTLAALVEATLRVLYWTPMFRASIERCGRQLYLYGGLPYVSGPLRISVGDGCRISGRTTFSGRTVSSPQPQLVIGNNVDIGWMSTIAVGTRVVIGDNTRIAGQAFIAGYPGHPLDHQARARGEADRDEQARDVIIGDDCWIATGVTILPGVSIGARSIIATGSVVTRDVPADVLVGGNPARVIRALASEGDDDGA